MLTQNHFKHLTEKKKIEKEDINTHYVTNSLKK